MPACACEPGLVHDRACPLRPSPRDALRGAEALHGAVADPPVPWRVGRHVARTLYIGDRLVGLVDTPELAAAIVAAMNR